MRPRSGDGWPVVAEETDQAVGLSDRAEGWLVLDPVALQVIAPQKYGEFLGRAVFTGEILALFEAARARSGDRLHVALCLEAEGLRTLRWERLCAPDGERWRPLLLDQRTPFSQHIPTSGSRRFHSAGLDELRALVLVASPAGLDSYGCATFDVNRVIDSVRQALGPVPFDVLANTPGTAGPPTLDTLCERITEGGYGLLHIASHGRSIDGESVIFLSRSAYTGGRARPGDQVDPVDTAEFVDRLRNVVGSHGLPRLIFLAGCETAQPDIGGALGGMAQGLVRNLGIPAAVAMTDQVSLETAVPLAAAFYRGLRTHGYADQALAEALAGLAARHDVAVPVMALFTRLVGRSLFVQGSTGGRPAAAPEPPRVAADGLPRTGKCTFGRDGEIGVLESARLDPAVNIVAITGMGGSGKSALVVRWFGRLAKDGYPGYRRVYTWSAGRHSNPNPAMLAHQFIEETLRWFGDDDPQAGTPLEMGRRLARLVQDEANLLVLDGLEVFQQATGEGEGRLKDPAVEAFLVNLASGNPGLCVVTSMLSLTDLEPFDGTTVRCIALGGLSSRTGAQLLKDLKVKGPSEELEAASREYGGHCLALTLLGNYLAQLCGGDVYRRREIDLLRSGESDGAHAERVIRAYEHALGQGAELAVLRVLGLFDRPASAAEVQDLRARPAIPGLTDQPPRSVSWLRGRSMGWLARRLCGPGILSLDPLCDAEWGGAVARLRRLGILAREDEHDPGLLDAHPLIRNHFGERLRMQDHAAWRAGHSRLFGYLLETSEDRPATTDAMARVYAALYHGCRAGRYGEALQVYRERIQRGTDRFSLHRLGESGPGLLAMRQFCKPGGYDPVDELGAADRAFILAEAARYLRARGRLRESADAFRASLGLSASLGRWDEAARRAGNLSQALMWLGRLEEAEAQAVEGQRLADRHGDAELRMSSRTDVAEALHQRGRLDEADRLFREAISIQEARQPDLPLLNGVEGVRYLDLLLTLGRSGDAESHLARLARLRQARGMLPGDSLLVAALDDLLRGRTHLALAVGEDAEELLRIGILFDHAVEGLRRAGTFHHLPRGLFARADLHRRRGDARRAEEDLAEARFVAERGEMQLHLADYWLAKARLERDLGHERELKESLDEAKKLIEGIGYRRRSQELEELT